MKDCDKLKKRALIGVSLLIIYFTIGKIIDISTYIGLELDILFAIISFLISMYLLLPYIGCLEDSNKSHKPPFTK